MLIARGRFGGYIVAFGGEPGGAGDLEVAEAVSPLDGGLQGDVLQDEAVWGRGNFFASGAFAEGGAVGFYGGYFELLAEGREG